MQDLHLHLLTRAPLAERDIGERILRTIFSAHPDLAPLRYGNHEPLKYKIGGELDMASVMQQWSDPFLWSNGRRTQGSVWFGSATVHRSISISCTAARLSPNVAAKLVSHLALLLEADFAYVHFQHEDQASYLKRYAAVYPLCLGVTTHDLQRSIPELPWMTIFGPPYVSLFSLQVLSTCPAFESVELAPGYWRLQLTSDPLPARKDPLGYEKVRDAAKARLGWQHFLSLSDPEAFATTPSFEWAPVVRNPLIAYLREHNLLKE